MISKVRFLFYFHVFFFDVLVCVVKKTNQKGLNGVKKRFRRKIENRFFDLFRFTKETWARRPPRRAQESRAPKGEPTPLTAAPAAHKATARMLVCVFFQQKKRNIPIFLRFFTSLRGGKEPNCPPVIRLLDLVIIREWATYQRFNFFGDPSALLEKVGDLVFHFLQLQLERLNGIGGGGARLKI